MGAGAATVSETVLAPLHNAHMDEGTDPLKWWSPMTGRHATQKVARNNARKSRGFFFNKN
jgi:hypothetical protein